MQKFASAVLSENESVTCQIYTIPFRLFWIPWYPNFAPQGGTVNDKLSKWILDFWRAGKLYVINIHE